MHRTARHHLLAVTLCTVLAMSSACGSGDDNEGGAAPTPSTSTSATDPTGASASAAADPAHAVEVATLLGRNLEAYKQANGKYPRAGSTGYDQTVGIDAARGLHVSYSVDGAGAMIVCVADDDGSASYASKDGKVVAGDPDGCGF